MRRDLEYFLPIFEVTNDGIFSKTGDFTIGYEIIKSTMFGSFSEELAAIHQAWVMGLRVFNGYTVIYIQDWYTSQIYRSDPDHAGDGPLAQASERHFHERPYRSHRCYCFITHRFSSQKASSKAFPLLLQSHLIPEYMLRPRLLEDFFARCQQFEHLLTDSGLIKISRLSLKQLVSACPEVGIIEQYISLITDLNPVLRDISLQPEVQVGDRRCVLYTLADAELLPAQCSSSTRYEPYSTEITSYPIPFASCLGPLLDVDHIYSQFIFLDEAQPILSRMESRRRRLQALATHSKENAVAADAIEQFLREAAESQRLPVRAHFNIMAWGDNPADIKDLKQKVSSAIARMGAVPHLETIGASPIWWAGIPGNAANFPMYETFTTFAEQAACFLIPETNDKFSVSPVGIRLGDRHSGIPKYVDISDAPLASGQINNRNKFVLGGSGSGKSFLINLFIRCYFANGAHILLVDVGGSYKNICSILGGLYLTYQEDSPICLNPFLLEEGRQPDIEKKESIITLLLAISKKGDESFNRFEYVALSNALRRYYEYLAANPHIAACFNSFYEFLTDHYSIILKNEKVREKNFDLESFLYVLRPYYKGGEYDYLLNAVDQPAFLHQQLIIFELDNIKDHPILFPVVTIIIMETFISKMRKLKGVRKIFIIEEAWKALAKEGMSEYIKYLFRTVRKFFGEAMLVTQDLEDIISNPIVKNTIINNSDCKLLLDQSKFKHRFQQVQEILGLNEKDKTMVLSLNKANDPSKKYKEVFISLANGPSKVYRVEVSLEEYLVYTTEEREKEKLNEYSLKYGGIRKGVAALAAEIRAGLVQFLLTVAFSALFLLMPNGHASAQILDLIEAAVKEALVTADLKIQRQQTQTLLLQNAQKALENTMQSELLDDITSWVQQQENLYSEYYQELWQVKSALSAYSKVRYLISRQAQLVKEYQQSWALVRQDPHFSTAEISHIANVYTGILNESLRNIGELTLAIKAFATQMDDAGRLRLIDETGSRIDRNYNDLRRYTQENTLLSLQRAKDQQNLQTIRTLYGLQ